MPELVGRTLGHYKLTEKIGEGGMGSVYRAHDERLDRFVAVKVLPREVAANPDRLERFEREARAAAALDHPNILAIHELGFHEGEPFIVTELLEGSSLRDLLEGGVIPPEKALDYGTQVARGLAAAHDKGIIHRDLKPENIFVTGDGTVKILDFGLAKLTRAHGPEEERAEAATDTMNTALGTVMGTTGYMSPEQVRGLAVDSRSDVFSFGILLYESFTGSNPFRRSTTADSVSAVLGHDPPPVTSTAVQVPEMVDTVARRCLEKRPDDRYQSTRDLMHALEAVMDDVGAGRGARPGRSVQRKLAAVIFAVVACALLIALTYFGLRWVTPEDTPAAGDSGPPRIMVFPFENLGSQEDDYFAAGMADELTSRLASVHQLRVVSASGNVQLAGNVVVHGGEPDIDFAITGTVRWNRRSDGSEQVRITPKLIRIGDGRLLWSQGYDRQLDNIFEVQSDIAGRVLDELDIVLLREERAAIDVTPTSDMEAYQAYLRGLYYAESIIEEELYLAVSMFEQAVELDPGFALAHAELAMAHSRLVENRIDTSPSRSEKARLAAQRSLDLEPNLARAHLARAVFLWLAEGDTKEALAELAVARRERPNDGPALMWEGLLLKGEGRLDEAVTSLGRALDVDPANYRARLALGGALLKMRHYAAADLNFQQAIRLQPDRLPAYLGRFWNALPWEGGTGLGYEILESVPANRHRDVLEVRLFALMADREFEGALELLRSMKGRGVESMPWRWSADLLECHALYWLERRAEARQSCSLAVEQARTDLESRPRDPRLWAAAGYGHALLGEDQQAIAAAETAVRFAAPRLEDQDQFRRDLAAILAMVGETERAVEILRDAVESPGWLSRAWLGVDWRYDRIRGDDAFQELMQPAE